MSDGEKVAVTQEELARLYRAEGDLILFQQLSGCKTPKEFADQIRELSSNNEKILEMLAVIKKRAGIE